MWSRKRGQVFGLRFDGLFADQEVFELDGREVAQSGMKALGVIEGFNIIKEHGLGLLKV